MSHNMGREQTMFYFNVMEWEIGSKRWETGESTVRVGQVEMVKEKNPEKVFKAERAGYIYMAMCAARIRFLGRVKKRVVVRLRRHLSATWRNMDTILQHMGSVEQFVFDQGCDRSTALWILPLPKCKKAHLE